ncbi:MAG: PAS domain-containing protein [Pseudomonadota bacterium]
MSEKFSILLIDDNDIDRQLASSVLRQRFPQAEIAEVDTALSFARHFAAGGFDVAVTELGLAWADGQDILGAIRRHFPACVTVGLAREAQTITPGFDRGEPSLTAMGDLIEKSASGILALPETIARELQLSEDDRRAVMADAAYQRLQRELPVGVFSTDATGKISRVNTELLRLLGYSSDEALIGKSLFSLIEPAEARRRAETAFASGDACRSLFAEVRAAANRRIDTSLGFWPVPGLDWAPAGFEGVMWFARPQESRSRLSTATAQGTQPASAHQDSAPPRSGPRDRAGPDSPEPAEPNANPEWDPEKTLAAFSIVEIDLAAALNVAVESHLNANPGRSVVETPKPLPTIRAQPREITELLYGLVNIAAKLPGPQPAYITVDTATRSEHWVIGVHRAQADPNAHTPAVGARALPSDAVNIVGSNAGLALCTRIAQRHGGTVWTDSEPNRVSLYASISRHLMPPPTSTE